MHGLCTCNGQMSPIVRGLTEASHVLAPQVFAEVVLGEDAAGKRHRALGECGAVVLAVVDVVPIGRSPVHGAQG